MWLLETYPISEDGMKRSKPLLFILVALFLFLVLMVGCDENDKSYKNDPTQDDDDDDDAKDDDANDDDDSLDDDDYSPAPIELVDLFMGTGGVGYGAAQLHPGPQTPNGMVRPGPDTSKGPWFYMPEFQHYAGYWDRDTHIRGFSQNRMIGTGDSDYGNVRLMPLFGISNEAVKDVGYLAKIDKEMESAEVGLYKVGLADSGIFVEIAAADLSTMHRFTYPEKGGAPYLIIDVCASIRPGDVRGAEVEIDSVNNEISGGFLQQGEFSSDYGGIQIYFVLKSSLPFADFGTFDSDQISAQSLTASGDDIGAFVGFDPGFEQEVLITIALSFISVEQARANLEIEMEDLDFEGVVEKNRDMWRGKLGRVKIEGGTKKQQRLFYTALYRSYIMPTLFTEKGGWYMGFDGEIHKANGFTYYTDMSLWDTFRTLHPLITLIEPTLSRDFVISLLKMSKQGGYLPRWPQGNGYTSSMIGTHSDAVITEAYLKGITDFDVEAVYEKMYIHATEETPEAGRSGLEHYIDFGYCASDYTSGSVSKTLEYAFDDFCLSRLAEALGRQGEADMFANRAKNYTHLWDSVTQFMRGRDSAGAWAQPFLSWYPWANEYIQGNARHWSWFVPHDVPGLIALYENREDMVQNLDDFFEKSVTIEIDALPNLYYWHGNQHDLHAAFLFNEAGRPDLTQKWTRYILEKHYNITPEGLAGNEDGGTLMAWYVFSAMGLFPLNPCSTGYQLTSPLFDKVTLGLPGGDFIITTKNNSAENIYIQSAYLNGEPLLLPWLEHGDVASGGKLHFIMGPQPSSWGAIRGPGTHFGNGFINHNLLFSQKIFADHKLLYPMCPRKTATRRGS